MSKTIGTIVGIVIIVFAAVMFFTANQTSNNTDELTGKWYTESVTEDISWSVEYTFKDGRYTSLVKQDNGADERFDEGPYRILSRHEDGSMIVMKASDTFEKSYEVVISVAEDGNSLSLEGMKMDRVE